MIRSIRPSALLLAAALLAGLAAPAFAEPEATRLSEAEYAHDASQKVAKAERSSDDAAPQRLARAEFSHATAA